MKEILEGQLKKGMIRHSNSSYASPAFLVTKGGNRGYRLVVDMRVLNQHLEKSSWPIPRMHEIVDKMHGASYFTSLDLSSYFHQLPISEESRKYTAFITDEGLFEDLVVPMGLSTAPNHAQYVIRVLGGMFSEGEVAKATGIPQGAVKRTGPRAKPSLVGTDCYVYIDDVLIWSRTLEEHVEKLERVIERLMLFDLRAKAPKCHIAVKELLFLGTMLGQKGRWPNPEKTAAIDAIPIPSGRNAKSQILAILGLAGFYRIHIKDFEAIVDPLRNLTKAGVNAGREWSSVHTHCLNKLKSAFKSAPILAHPDFDQPFVVKTDSSKTHVGAILGQIQEGHFRVMEYASKKLNKDQRNWHMTHLERYSVVWALAKWERYLEGKSDTKVYTDHKALTWLRYNKYNDCSGKLVRWFSFIDYFNIDLIFRRGVDNGDADALTRMYENEEDITWAEPHPDQDWMFDALIKKIPSRIKTVFELQYRGPKGAKCFKAKGLECHKVQPGKVKDCLASAETLVVGTLPPHRDKLKALFEDLHEKGNAFAVWAPLTVLQASYFRCPDVQIIVIQGAHGYGSTTRGTPVRGAWVTHGVLGNNEFFRASINRGKTTTSPLRDKSWRGLGCRTIRTDWEEWDKESSHIAPAGSTFREREAVNKETRADNLMHTRAGELYAKYAKGPYHRVLHNLLNDRRKGKGGNGYYRLLHEKAVDLTERQWRMNMAHDKHLSPTLSHDIDKAMWQRARDSLGESLGQVDTFRQDCDLDHLHSRPIRMPHEVDRAEGRHVIPRELVEEYERIEKQRKEILRLDKSEANRERLDKSMAKLREEEELLRNGSLGASSGCSQCWNQQLNSFRRQTTPQKG